MIRRRPSPGDANKPAGGCAARSMSASRAPCSAATCAVAAPRAPNAPVMAIFLPFTVDIMSHLWPAPRGPEYHRGSCRRLSRHFQGAQSAKGEIGAPIRALLDPAQVREALDQRRDCQVPLEPGECAAQAHVGVPAERY